MSAIANVPVSIRELAAASASIEELLPVLRSELDDAREPLMDIRAGLRRMPFWRGTSSQDWLRPALVSAPASRANVPMEGARLLADAVHSIGERSGNPDLAASTQLLYRRTATLLGSVRRTLKQARSKGTTSMEKVVLIRTISTRPFGGIGDVTMRKGVVRQIKEVDAAIEEVARDLRVANAQSGVPELRAKLAVDQRNEALRRYTEQRKALELA